MVSVLLGSSCLGLSVLPEFGYLSLVAQLLKNTPAMRETWVQPVGWEDALE